jgi:hypothetical protein
MNALTAPKLTRVTMAEIRREYDPGEGRHWFDRGTMSFFGTRLPRTGRRGPGGTYFVTSEQPPHGDRRWSVRKLVGPGEIETVGEFCAMTKAQAEMLAKRLAQGHANA